MSPVLTALVLAIWAYICVYDMLAPMFVLANRPLIAGFVTGLIVGDVESDAATIGDVVKRANFANGGDEGSDSLEIFFATGVDQRIIIDDRPGRGSRKVGRRERDCGMGLHGDRFDGIVQGLGDERHDRVGDAVDRREDRTENGLLGGIVSDGSLDSFEVPIAEIAPDEIID